ncbi:MAG: ASCH domain-containing protein [Sodaliphilus sp.]
MKVLSIQQPWATLICHGIKDVENRTWKPKIQPEKILIHASKGCTERCLNTMPLEWAQDIMNEIVFGNIPYYKDMPSGAIIGYATIEAINHKTEQSMWACGKDDDPDCYYWHLKDAHVFIEPITDVKGKLYLWDYEIDEDHLPPARKVNLFGYFDDGDNMLRVGVNDHIFGAVDENKFFEFELDLFAQDICEEGVYVLKPFSKITFYNRKNEERVFHIRKAEAVYPIDKDNNPILYPSILLDEDQPHWLAEIHLGAEIKE